MSSLYSLGNLEVSSGGNALVLGKRTINGSEIVNFVPKNSNVSLINPHVQYSPAVEEFILCDETGKMIYYCETNKNMNFNSGFMIVLRKDGDSWKIGYKSTEFVCFKFDSVAVTNPPVLPQPVVNPQCEEQKPWYSGRWFWIIGGILLLLLIILIIVAIVFAVRRKKTKCIETKSKPQTTCYEKESLKPLNY